MMDRDLQGMADGLMRVGCAVTIAVLAAVGVGMVLLAVIA